MQEVLHDNKERGWRSDILIDHTYSSINREAVVGGDMYQLAAKRVRLDA